MTAPTPDSRVERVRDEMVALLERVQKDNLGHRPYERGADAILSRWLVLDLSDPALVEGIADVIARNIWSGAPDATLVGRAVLAVLAGDPS